MSDECEYRDSVYLYLPYTAEPYTTELVASYHRMLKNKNNIYYINNV